jgi:hypothetical protein
MSPLSIFPVSPLFAGYSGRGGAILLVHISRIDICRGLKQQLYYILRYDVYKGAAQEQYNRNTDGENG